MMSRTVEALSVASYLVFVASAARRVGGVLFYSLGRL